jgi:adenylate cyclase
MATDDDLDAPTLLLPAEAPDPDGDRWRRLRGDPLAAAAALQRDPAELAAFVAHASALARAHEELRQQHEELTMLHEATLEHSQEIEEQLAVKVEEVEALVVDLELRNAFIREVFGRYITDDVVDTLLASPDALQLGGENREITIMMADLRGFSSLCERLSPAQVVSILNTYLGAMADVIDGYRGSVNEFIGDAILAVFGAPIATADHAERAVACALAMQAAMDGVNARLRADGLPALEMGIGVHTGEVVVGNIGSQKRAKYGVVGSHVNLTSRIESYTVGGQVLISETTADRLAGKLQTRGSFRVLPKGARHALTIWDVAGISGDYAISLIEPGAEVRRVDPPAPVRFTVFEGKDASGEPRPAELLALDERGNAELRADDPPEALANLKLALAGLDDEDAYAKVLEAVDGRFRVRLTSVPPRLAAALAALTGAAAAS